MGKIYSMWLGLDPVKYKGVVIRLEDPWKNNV